MDIVIWVTLGISVLNLVLLLVIHDGTKHIWHKVEHISKLDLLILKRQSTTQSQLRTRRAHPDGVEPIMDPKPKVEQPYAGQGVQRTAPGTAKDEAGGESPTTRVVQVKRVWAGGKDGEDPRSRFQQD